MTTVAQVARASRAQVARVRVTVVGPDRGAVDRVAAHVDAVYPEILVFPSTDLGGSRLLRTLGVTVWAIVPADAGDGDWSWATEVLHDDSTARALLRRVDRVAARLLVHD